MNTVTTKYEVILEERDGSELVSQEKFFSQFPIYTQNNNIFQLRLVGGQPELFEIDRDDLFNKQLLIDEGTATALSAQDIFAAGVVAKPGGGQDIPNAETVGFKRVITVATNGDSITLEVSKNNRKAVIFNSGIKTLAVFPFTAGTFDGGTPDASINVPAGTVMTIIGTSATNWDTIVSSSGTLAGILAVGNTMAAEQKLTFNSSGTNKVLFDDSNTTVSMSIDVDGTNDIRIESGAGKSYFFADDSLTEIGFGGIAAPKGHFFADIAGCGMQFSGATEVEVGDGALGFFGTSPVAQPSGVAVSAAAVHAALVTLGLITA